MTNKIIPADKVQRIAAAMRAAMRRDELTYSYGEFLGDMSDYIRELEALLAAPTPPPSSPTMADMTYEERAACQWMQCDVIGFRGKYTLISPSDWDGDAVLLGREGEVHYENHAMVVPRPDLPRMEWPGDQKPAPALPDGWRLADHPGHGRVVVTTPEPDEDGDVYFVYRDDELSQGHDLHWCKPDDLTYLDQEADQ